MSQSKEEEFLERLSKCITTCQAIHNDSRTPLAEARRLVEPIRELHRCRQALRSSAFHQTGVNDIKFTAAMDNLKGINNTIKADIMAHNKTMEFVNNATVTAAAVLDLAIGVGSLVA